MDKLSELIQEAKPLYKQRKRQKRAALTIVCFIAPVVIFTGAMNVYTMGNNLYLSLENNSLQNELLEDNMGLLR